MTELQKKFNEFNPIFGPIQDFNNLINPIHSDSFNLKKINSYEMYENIDKLKHGFYYRIRTLLLFYPSFEEIKSFNFKYHITADNLPEPAYGTLHIKVKNY